MLEAGEDVGGTWYWNRYPGARCDIQTTDYTYTWDPELETGWTWSEKYATQPEILRYAQHVADKHDLRRDIRFGDPGEGRRVGRGDATWRVTTGAGDTITCRWYVMATGCLSMPKELDIEGTDRFRGDVYFTSRWPHEGVDLTGKRVGVIGTGSSGIQSIPIMAPQASRDGRVPAHAELLDPGPQRPPVAGAPRPDRRRPRGLPPVRQVVARRRADAGGHRDRGDVDAGGTQARPQDASASWCSTCSS